MTFSLGDAYADEEKNLLLAMWNPSMAELGPIVVARLEVTFAEIGETEIVQKTIIGDVRVNIAAEGEARDAHPYVQVLEQYGLQLAARARKDAIQKADAGEYQKAKQALSDAAAVLERLPDPANQLSEEVRELRHQADQLDEASYSHDRKVLREVAYSASTGRLDNVRASRARRKRTSA